MAERFSTGIDWSGDPGRPLRDVAQRDWIVLAACHASIEAEPLVATAMENLKSNHRPIRVQALKHKSSRNRVRSDALKLIKSTELSATVIVADKRRWDSYPSSGSGRIVTLLTNLIESIPDIVVCDQRLLVDANRGEKGFLAALRRESKSVSRTLKRPDFAKIAERPDHRSDAQLVQLADMVAGHVMHSVVRSETVRISKLEIRYI